jgi:hypothetical protein
MVGRRQAPATLSSGKTLYLLHRRLSGHQGRSGRVRKISSPAMIWSPDRAVRNEPLYGLSHRLLIATNSCKLCLNPRLELSSDAVQ